MADDKAQAPADGEQAQEPAGAAPLELTGSDNPDVGGENTLTGADFAGSGDLVEVYRTDSDFVAQVAVEEVLRPAGIATFIHDRQSHAIPVPASLPGQVAIAVPSSQADRAAQLLREARLDGLLVDDGDVTDVGGEDDERTV